jgi:O-antigen ligase
VKAVAPALAAFFALVGFYTSLAALSPTPPVGYVFASRTAAAVLVAVLAGTAGLLGWRLLWERARIAEPSRALLGAWIGSAALSSALGLDPASGFAVVAIMLLGGVFHVALVRFYARPGVAATLVSTYLVTGLAASLAGLAMFAIRRPAELFALNNGRAAGVFVTANQFAAYLIALVFVALGTALASGGRLRLLAAATAAVAATALVLTVSVSALFGSAVAGTFYCAALGARRTAAVLAVVLIFGAAGAAFVPALRHNPADSLDRLRIWQAGLRVAELFPLTGVGPMTYYRVYPAVRPPNGDLPGTFGALHPHDAYLSLAGETGLVGLAAAAYGWLRFGRAFGAGVRAGTLRGRRFAFGVAAALVAVAVQGLFDTVGVVEMAFVWIPFAALGLAAAKSGLPVGSGAA